MAPDFLISWILYVVPFLIVLGVVVTVHELGHFLTARALGTKVDRFSIGFGRPIASWRDRGGVEWRVGWIPLGGYVKFAGDENAASVPDEDDLSSLRREIILNEGASALGRYFHFKPLWQRALVVVAGPAANFLLAIAIFAGLLYAFGQPITPARADAIEPGSPAAQAGFLPGDVVVRANGKRIESFSDLQMVVMLNTGSPVEFVVLRQGRETPLTATPVRAAIKDQLGHVQHLGKLGLESVARPQDVRVRHFTPLGAIAAGAGESWERVTTTLTYLGRLATGRETAEQLSGPLGMAQLSGDIAKRTAQAAPDAKSFVLALSVAILELIANISVAVGFLNLLPVPVLDGGHLMFYAYEAVARRPLTAKIQAAGYRLGLALVLGLMLFATWNDLQRLNVFKLFGALFS
jgi:regulator of sigma E protease